MSAIPRTVEAAIEAELQRLFKALGIVACAALAHRERYGSPAGAPDIEAALDAAHDLIALAVSGLDVISLSRSAHFDADARPIPDGSASL